MYLICIVVICCNMFHVDCAHVDLCSCDVIMLCSCGCYSNLIKCMVHQ